eukprot:CAMPEP_0195533748 /NCGR_PEP_ID=MMETSP0794_2-20130614/41112_1 /TAXON_ID=515487 /ORGANISM="Stephanopyxis turris, Strain CCMP 815" /LENGTH=235 /DNA_ID=CAMNT_0040666389 /DNA_START=375 /DNA_END=1082 /DNA_ORIENTATION=-
MKRVTHKKHKLSATVNLTTTTPEKTNDSSKHANNNAPPNYYQLTNPLQIGNLYDTCWNYYNNDSCSNDSGTAQLRTRLLMYYLSCGWNNNSNTSTTSATTTTTTSDQDDNDDNDESADKLFFVLLAAASRGDIIGMSFILQNYGLRGFGLNNTTYNPYSKQTRGKELCTVAGAAGKLDALKWLREEMQFPWDAAEVFREALENSQDHVVDYVEMNTDKNCIQLPYGDGMPYGGVW